MKQRKYIHIYTKIDERYFTKIFHTINDTYFRLTRIYNYTFIFHILLLISRTKFIQTRNILGKKKRRKIPTQRDGQFPRTKIIPRSEL